MRRLLSQRLLPLLQLTRMALVFTAIADSQTTLLLWARARTPAGTSLWDVLNLWQILAILLVSVGLYAFGMSLNDIVDRRRDRLVAAHRPLPSGRIGVVTAHIVCILLAGLALSAGTVYALGVPHGWLSLVLLVCTGLLITFYDFAGKYLVATGLLSLGLVRFFHALIPAPGVPLLWHPLLLLNHVTILSTVAYHWEEKRPPLTRIHWWGVPAGLAFVDLTVAAAIWWARRGRGSLGAALWIEQGLLLPLGALLAFIVIALLIWRRHGAGRAAGQQLMLCGLLWLIVYDAAFVAGYVGAIPGLAILSLLIAAYLSVQLMRWWSKVSSVVRRPPFQRTPAG